MRIGVARASAPGTIVRRMNGSDPRVWAVENPALEREQQAAWRDMISPWTLWLDPLRLDRYPPGLLLSRSLTQWMGGLGMGPNSSVCVAPMWSGSSRSCVPCGERVAADSQAALWSADGYPRGEAVPT
jgi:hypothetical protein